MKHSDYLQFLTKVDSKYSPNHITNSSSYVFFYHYLWSVDATPNNAWIMPKVGIQEIYIRKIFSFELFSNYSILVSNKFSTLVP